MNTTTANPGATKALGPSKLIGIDLKVVGINKWLNSNIFSSEIRIRDSQWVHPEYSSLNRELVGDRTRAEFLQIVKEGRNIALDSISKTCRRYEK